MNDFFRTWALVLPFAIVIIGVIVYFVVWFLIAKMDPYMLVMEMKKLLPYLSDDEKQTLIDDLENRQKDKGKRKS